jgi:hypothetical protein
MKERPIPFSAPMVRAVLDGTKTQTRRIVRHQYGGAPRIVGDGVAFLDAGRRTGPDQLCPYGVSGDRLWVREAWRASAQHNDLAPREIPVGDGIEYHADDKPDYLLGRYRHARFMMRWMSRITLEITAVRVERLQDISEEGAIAEGVEREGIYFKSYEKILVGPHKGKPHPHSVAPNRSPLTSYRELWESINGAGAWAANPWVWVIEFRRITP